MPKETIIHYDPLFGTEFYLFQIEAYPNYYVEPIYGRIWSTNYGGRWMKCWTNTRGYLSVHLSNNKKRSYTVHILIFRTINSISLTNQQTDGLSIDHIDRDKRNNSISNLRLATMEEQLSNSAHPMKKVTAFKDGRSFGPYPSINECARQLGLNNGGVYEHLKDSGRRSNVGGYTLVCL